jgi:hypothetical protein
LFNGNTNNKSTTLISLFSTAFQAYMRNNYHLSPEYPCQYLLELTSANGATRAKAGSFTSWCSNGYGTHSNGKEMEIRAKAGSSWELSCLATAGRCSATPGDGVVKQRFAL